MKEDNNLPNVGLIFHVVDRLQEKQINREKYPILDSELPVEDWWNNLSEKQQIDIGAIAIHFYYMTANCRWHIVEWSKLPKLQQNRIKKTYNRKNDKSHMIDPYGLFGCSK